MATRGASGTPPLTGWFLTFPDCLHPPWLHKTPGAEKTKKPKRGGASIRPRGQKRLKSQKGLTPVGRTVPGAPMLRNAVRGCFYDF